LIVVESGLLFTKLSCEMHMGLTFTA